MGWALPPTLLRNGKKAVGGGEFFFHEGKGKVLEIRFRENFPYGPRGPPGRPGYNHLGWKSFSLQRPRKCFFGGAFLLHGGFPPFAEGLI